MAKKLGSILEELDSIVAHKDKDLILEARAMHAISNAIHVLKQINEHYSADEADELSRRFMLAIKNNNIKKFETGIRTIKEGKQGK